MLTECHVQGNDIMLELTESALMKDADKAVVILKSLRENRHWHLHRRLWYRLFVAGVFAALPAR